MTGAAHYEFGGRIGAVGIIFGLPFVTYALQYLCGKDYCLDPSNVGDALSHLFPPASAAGGIADLFSLQAFAIVFGWFLFQVVLERVLPGPVYDGVELSDGTKLKYNCNGHRALWVSVLAVGAATKFGVDFGVLFDLFPQLITATLVLSVLMSVYLFAASFAKGALLSEGGDTPSHLYNFFIGRELNPRVLGTFDLKEFQWRRFVLTLFALRGNHDHSAN